MRNFFGTHWKAIVALLILIVVAAITMSPGAASPSLAERLRAHAQALATQADRPVLAARHIESALAADGYRLRRESWRSGERAIEVSLANPAPGTGAGRVFLIGANGANGSGAAAVLELARLLRHLRPGPGTELRFVFFMNQRGAPSALPPPERQGQVDDPGNRYPDTGNFIAFVGPPAAARQVREMLSAFRAVADFPSEGLAAPAFVQGVTLSGSAPCRRCGARSLVISDSAFLGYPYYHTGSEAGDDPDYDAIARVVDGLARNIGVLAEGQRG